MAKAVFDSTVLVSAFLTQTGISRELLHTAQAGRFSIYLCEEILAETTRVLLEYPRIRKRYHYSDEAAQEYVALLRVVCHIVTDLPKIKPIVRDPNDDMIIACAVKAAADYIVTRDQDLLALESYKEIGILSPEKFMRLI